MLHDVMVPPMEIKKVACMYADRIPFCQGRSVTKSVTVFHTVQDAKHKNTLSMTNFFITFTFGRLYSS